MTIHLEPEAIRAAWRHGRAASDELADARARTTEAAGTGMAGLATTLTTAATDLAGVLEVAEAVLAEHESGMEDCLADFAATDGAGAGRFDGVTRP